MFREALRLIQKRSRDPNHERTKAAFFSFLSLWVLCVLVSLVAHFLVISVQNLLVLHHAVSIAGALVARVVTQQAEGSAAYPFCFGFYRLRSVVSLAGAIFVAFGCLTTVVEGFHTALHTHYRDPRLLAVTALLHTALLVRYRTEVLEMDRICGRPANRSGVSPDEEHLFRVATTVPLQLQGEPMGGGHTIQGGDLGDGDVEGKGSKGSSSLPPVPPHHALHNGIPSRGPGSSGYGKVSALASLFSTMRLFLVPAATFASSLLMYTTHSTFPDTLITLALAAYYLSVAVTQGKYMVWGLVNNAVRDPLRLSAIDRALRAIHLLDGVLQVHSSAFFMVNPCEMVGMVRVRLMSGADAAAVTLQSRKVLSEVAKYSYVECFHPNARVAEDVLSRGFGPRFHLHIGVETDHGHSHGSHCHHGHNHDHGHNHGHDESPEPVLQEGSPLVTSPESRAAAAVHSPGLPPPPRPHGYFTANTSEPFSRPQRVALPARPVWDTPTNSGNNGASGVYVSCPSPLSGPHRTPLVPPSTSRPLSISPPPHLPGPTPRFPAAPGAMAGATSTAGDSETRPAVAATQRTTNSVPAPVTYAKTPVNPAPRHVTPGGIPGLNVPPPPSLYTPFRPTHRTDRDV